MLGLDICALCSRGPPASQWFNLVMSHGRRQGVAWAPHTAARRDEEGGTWKKEQENTLSESLRTDSSLQGMRYYPPVPGPKPKPQSGRATVVSLWWLLLLLLAAYIAPQHYLWQDVTAAVHHRFMDVHGHQVNLDTVCRQSTLPPQAFQDPFITNGPGRLDKQMYNPVRWPHGVYHVAALWSCGLGVLSPWTTRLTNLLFTVVLLVGVLGLTRQASGELGRRRPGDGLRLGLWAGVITLLIPPLLGSSLYLHLDYPLVAMVIMGLYLLALTRGLTHRPAILNFAIWSLLGLFIKLTYALYLFVPVAALLAALLLRRRWRSAVEALLAALIVAALCLVLQDIDLSTLLNDARAHATTQLYSGHDDVRQGTLRWAILPLILTWFSYPWPLLLLALPGLVRCHLRHGAWKNRLLLLAAIWGPVLLLCLMSNRMERYMHPVYPVLSVVTVLGVASLIPRRWLQPGLAAVAALHVGVLLFSHLEVPLPWSSSEEQMVSDQFFHETPIPDRVHLQRLRENGSHPRCNTRGLQDGIASLMRSAPPSLPLVVGVNGGSNGEEFTGNQRGLDNYLHLYTLQIVRDRFIFEADLSLGEPEHALKARLAPLVLSLHHPNEPTDDLLPHHDPVERKMITIPCLERTLRKELVLYRKHPDG